MMEYLIKIRYKDGSNEYVSCSSKEEMLDVFLVALVEEEMVTVRKFNY